MAARRLLIIMLVLLGISTLAAALVDTRSFREEGTGSTIASETEPTEPPDTVPEGKALGISVVVGGAKVKVIPMQVGDQLELIVRSPKTDLLEIPALGLLEPVAPNAPARFDVLAQESGSYGVRLVNADRVVARIDVSGGKGKPEGKKGGS